MRSTATGTGTKRREARRALRAAKLGAAYVGSTRLSVDQAREKVAVAGVRSAEVRIGDLDVHVAEGDMFLVQGDRRTKVGRRTGRGRCAR